MAPSRPAVVLLLFQCILFISASQTEKTLSELNELYRPQIWTLLDFLNADPNREYNYRIYKYVNSAQKTDGVIDLEIEVGADCLDQYRCSRAVLQCRGYVEYFPNTDSHRALPGAQCQEKWRDNGNGIPDVSAPNVDAITERVVPPQTVPCLGCPQAINNNAEGVDGLLKLALQHIESERTKKHAVVEVVSVHRQIVAGVKYILIAKIAPTLCPNDPNLINAELCPVDEKVQPEYCRVEFFQKPTFSTDDHIVSNNCTASQEFAPKKFRDDSDNEINGYQRPADAGTDGPNFEQIAQSGSLDGMTPERLAAVEAQIIPTDPTGVHPVVETTKVDNSQLGVDDIPSVQTSTNDMLYGGNHEHVTELQINDDLQQKAMPMETNTNTEFSNEETGVVYPEDSYEYLDKMYRTKRLISPSQISKFLVKREVAPAPPQSSESHDTSEEADAEKKQVKRQAAPETSESDTSEEVPKTTHAVYQRRRRETPPGSSESSEETKDPNAPLVKPQSSESSEETKDKDGNAQPVKRQSPPQSSESSEETKDGNAQIVKRQAPPQSSESSEETKDQHVKRQAPPQSSESSEETKDGNAQIVKRQAPPQSSESSEETKDGNAQPVKRQAPPQSSESSEETKDGNAQIVKRQAPPQSSESSEETKDGNAQIVKRQAPPQSSESSEETKDQHVKRQAPPQSSESSEETKDGNAQIVKRQAPPQSSETSEETKDGNAQNVKLQAPPPQSSETSEETKDGNAQIVKRQAAPQSSESSEETPAPQNLERRKRAAKDSSSSSSSSSSEEDKKNNNGDDDDDDNGKHKKKHDDDDDNGKHKKRHGKNKNDDDDDDDDGNGKGKKSSKNKKDDDDDDDNGKGKKSSKNKKDDDDDKNGNGKDSSSSSSSSSSDEENNGNNREKRGADDSSSSSSDDDDDDKNGKNDNGKDDDDKNGKDDDDKNGKQRGKDNDDTSSSSSSSDDDDHNNGKKRGKRDADSSSSSSSSDEDNGNGKNHKDEDNGNGKNHKDNNKKENDDDTSSSSSSSDDDDDKKNRRKRELSSLVKPTSDEKLVVRKVAEFAAKSFDDATHKHRLLEIENVKKLSAEGTIYHIRIRVAVWKCLLDVCSSDGEKLCKLKVYVSPSGKMEINKSHSHRIISEADKNRTDRFDEVDAINDKEVMDLVTVSRLNVPATVLKATKRMIGASTLYKINVKIADCSSDDCAGRFCEITAWVQNEVTDGTVTNVTCDNVRSERQILDASFIPQEATSTTTPAPTTAPVDNAAEIHDLMHIAVLELDPHTPHKTKYKVLNIINSTKEVVSGVKYTIRANMVLSDCQKNIPIDSHDCGQMTNEEPKICNIEILNRDWLENGKNTKISCGIEQYDFLSHPRHKVYKRQALVGAPSAAKESDVQDLLSSTMVEMDSRTPHANKYKVVRVIESTVQVVAGALYKITAEMALSDCLKTDSKTYHECGLLSNTVPEVCEIEIIDQPWLVNGRRTTIKCPLEKYTFTTNSKSRSKRQVPGGVSDARHDPNVIDLTKSSLLLADTRSPHENKYKIVEILKATKQVTSGISYKIKAKVVISDCPKNDNREPEQCGQLESENPRFCDISITDKAWLGETGKETTVNCGGDTYKFPRDKLSKRSIRLGFLSVHNNSEEIEALLRVTVQELDEHTPHQNKYKVVNVIESSKQVVAGILYKIKANLVLSDCLKTDALEAHECHQLETEAPKTCNIEIWNRVWLDNGKNTTISCGKESYNFLTQPKHKLTKRDRLVGAPSPADEKAVEELLSTTMVELDSRTPHANKYKVVRVIKSTSQVVAGSLFKITAELALSDCLKTDSKEYSECGLSNSIPEVCEIEIVDQPWKDNGRQTTIKCPSENYNFKTNSKRRTRRQVPGAKTDVKLDDQSITDLTKSTLLYLDSRSPHDVKYKILEILEAKKQIVSGTKYFIKAKIILSDCKKFDSKDPVYCSEQKSAAPRICDIKIWDQPWERHGRKTNITCETETYQFRTGRSSGNLLGQDNHDFHYSMFRKFMKDHNKNYEAKGELKRRFKIFVENMRKIEILEKNEQGTGLYGPTKFADLTEEEFKGYYLGYRPELRVANEIPFAQAQIPDVELPKEFDWRKKGAVTEVKNQEQCGSCWAFSVTGNVEGQYALKYDKLLEFSEQELVDCDTLDEGCNGGLMDNAYRAIEKMGGLELESDYPYDAKDEKCHFDNSLSRVKLAGAVNISQDETDMARWLVGNGPISISINANAMQFYMGGVSHPLKFLCSPTNLDHGVLIVGYGVHKYPLFNRTLPYWIVKNSWGTSWGEQGYYRVFRGDGTCGLNQTPSSAIVA